MQKQADDLMPFEGGGEFVQRAHPSADLNDRVRQIDQDGIASGVVVASEEHHVVVSDRQAVFLDVLELRVGRREADRLAVDGFGALSSGVRDAGSGAGDDDAAAGGDFPADYVAELVAFFGGCARGGSGDYYFRIVHGIPVVMKSLGMLEPP